MAARLRVIKGRAAAPAPPPLAAVIIERPDDGSYAARWNKAIEIILKAGEDPPAPPDADGTEEHHGR
jgi:hypothetical protein